MYECIDHPEPALDNYQIPAPVVQTIIMERVKDRSVFLCPPSPFGSAVATILPAVGHRMDATMLSIQEGLSNPGHGHS